MLVRFDRVLVKISIFMVVFTRAMSYNKREHKWHHRKAARR